MRVVREGDSETSFLDYQTHLMHGMLHANGCGHLMRINGREAGSRTLSGQFGCGRRSATLRQRRPG